MSSSALSTLAPLLSSKGVVTSVEEFHQSVNIVYHDVEAEFYDEVHQDMWQDLCPHLRYSANLLIQHSRQADTLTLVDVGCGTGLATHALLNSPLRSHVREVHLVDTSMEMLRRASTRVGGSGVAVVPHHGVLEHASGIVQADIVVASSLLHHIPDLAAFLGSVNVRQNVGGLFLHLHDPTTKSLASKFYQGRLRILSDYRRLLRALRRTRLHSCVPRETVHSGITAQQVVDLVNEQLLQKQVIHTRLTPKELWSITDIRVEGLPYSVGQGVDLEQIAAGLPAYRRVASWTYAPFGEMRSDLPLSFRLADRALSALGVPGRNIAALWRKEH